MNYLDARSWLESVGGRELDRGPGVVIVMASRGGGGVSGRAEYDVTLKGTALKAAREQAFVRACQQLRHMLPT